MSSDVDSQRNPIRGDFALPVSFRGRHGRGVVVASPQVKPVNVQVVGFVCVLVKAMSHENDPAPDDFGPLKPVRPSSSCATISLTVARKS